MAPNHNTTETQRKNKGNLNEGVTERKTRLMEIGVSQ